MKIKELLEDIYVDLKDPSKLVIALSTGSTQRGSGKDFISTAKRRVPHSSSSESMTGGITVYSAYLYKHSQTTTDILNSIKGKGPYAVSDSGIKAFIRETAQYMSKALKSLNPDLIVYPKSSSDLIKMLVSELKHILPDAEVVDEAFVKNVINITGDDKKDRALAGSLIDVYHPKFETLSDKTVEELEKRLLTLLKRQGTGVVPIKSIYKPLAKFIKGFIKAEPNLSENLSGQSVLIIDDILSSGTTMKEMVKIVQDRGAEKVNGLTIFKRTAGSE